MRYEHRGDRAQRPCEAETRALVLAAKDDDERAAGSLIVAFTPSIRAVARGYCHWPSLDEGELVQDGIVGLLRAVHRFDSGVDAPFWAYAVFWVRQAMQRLVAELTGAVVLSDRALRQMARVKAARREYQRTHSGEPTSRDLAALTGFDVAHVDGLTVAERRPRTLGEPVREDSGSSMTLADLVVDPRAEDAYEKASSSIDSAPVEDLLVDRLSERERTVIRARFGLGGSPRTLRELGAQLRLSAERVRQIQECALGKLRDGAESTPHVTVGV